MTNEQELIDRAKSGDKVALAEIVNLSKNLVFNLAMRMLGNPADAEDASQEILIRVITGLGTFRGESAFSTWVYRVASNHLLTAKKRYNEEKAKSLEAVAEFLAEGVREGDPPVDDLLLIKEAKLRCTSAMLLGLDREHRLAFILGEILELPAEEAATVLDIQIDAFRKRLSRARQRMQEFTQSTCGIVDAANPCRCGRQIARQIRLGAFDPQKRSLTVLPTQPDSRQAALDAVDRLARSLALFRSHPRYAAPNAVVEGLRKIIETSGSNLFS